MRSYTPALIFVLLFALLPSQTIAVDETVVKTYCATTFGYQDLEALKADLLTNAKREAVNELFGELLSAATTVENFVVTSDQIRTSSIGFVRVQGNVSFANGENLAEVCVTINAYATSEDREKFEPVRREKRHCVTDAKLTTSELTAFAKEEVIVQTLLDYDRKLEGKDRSALLQLLQRVDYLESGFVAETETYCVRVSGYVVPIEVIAFLDAGEPSPNMEGTLPGLAGMVNKKETSSNVSENALQGSESIYPQQVECSSTIQFGQTMDCELKSAGQKNVHEFAAEADDLVSIMIAKTRGDLWPAFEIRDATGNVVEDNGNSCTDHDSDVVDFICRVPEAGVYSIMVYSHVRNNSGKYSLRLQRMNDPIGAVALEFGQTTDGSIDAIAENKYYTFAAEADDVVSVMIVKTRGDLWPAFILRDASGYWVKDDGKWCTDHDSDVVDFVCRLPEAGIYSIMVYSHVRNNSGKYSLRLQRMNDPIGAVALEFGQTTDGSIDAIAENKYYTFAAEADDPVRIAITKTRGDLWPAFILRDASGYWVKDDGKWCTDHDSDVVDFVCRLPEAGIYSIMVYSHVRDKSGKYQLTIDKN